MHVLNRWVVPGVLLSSMLAGAVILAQTPAQAPPPLVKEGITTKLSPHVHLIPDESVPAVPNVGIIVGSKATMVVDTGLGPRNAQAILREVAKVSKNTELYLVTTHFHPEHAGGLQAFPAGTTFVIPKVQQQDLDELGMDMVKTFASRTPLMGELLSGVKFRRADVLFGQQHEIDLGGVRVRLLAVGPTHTRGDTVIFVDGERVMFAGDVVMNRAFLAFGQYSSTRAWLAALDQLETLQPTIIIPSHGNRGGASLIGEQRGVLQALRTRVRELKAQGRSVDDAAKSVQAEFETKYAEWTAPARVGAAVRSTYAETP
jgi:glyoxylase-like metal-dependent hydrolase (beta-lactamase superfamily II)